MKITQTRLKKIIQEELAAVAVEGMGDGASEEHTPMMPPRPAAPSAEDLKLALQRIDELLNSGELSSGGWIEKSLGEIRSILTKSDAGAIEEGDLDEAALAEEEMLERIDTENVQLSPAECRARGGQYIFNSNDRRGGRCVGASK